MSSSSSEAGAIIAALMAYATIVAIIALVWIVLSIIGLWKVFSKAGEKGWKSIIPILNTYTLFKISWKPLMFWIYFGLSIATGIINSVSGNDSDNFGILILSLAVSVASLVISIMLYNKLSHAFGKGTGFTVGLVFLSPIFLMILGCGSAQYQGNGELPVNNTQM